MFGPEGRAILEIFTSRAHKQYGLESISQLEHALQTAQLAEQQNEDPSFILAALLHDIGHLTAGESENPAADGIDNRHEGLGANWLAARLPASVSEPVRLHVEAKRYLCASEPDYWSRLAPDSRLSLQLQGGPMGPEECASFLKRPYARAAVRLRRLDEQAKLENHATPPLQHFLQYLSRIDADPVDPDARRAFEKDGFVTLRNFFRPDEVHTIRSAALSLSTTAQAILERALVEGVSLSELARNEPGSLIVVPEADNSRQVCRFEFLLGADPQFARAVLKRLRPVMQALHGEPFVSFKDKENEKHPGGGAFRPHQDYAAYQSFGPRYNATAMLSIDSQTSSNGCLQFATNWMEVARDAMNVRDWVDGRPLFHFHSGGPSNGDIRQDISDRLTWVEVETTPADLVVFDSFVPHKSATNSTANSRRAMFMTFSAAREGNWYEKYYHDKRQNYGDPKFHVSTPTLPAPADSRA